MRSFPEIHFDVTNMSLTSWIEQEVLFCVHHGMQIAVFVISAERTFDDALQHYTEEEVKKKKKEKR